MHVNLALQGGGAHGAFTWGVLDRLLEEPDLKIAGVSGTSAGALNGAALKAGLARGGAAAARRSLAQLWSDVAKVGDFRLAPWMKMLWPQAIAMADFASGLFPVSAPEIASQFVSPYSWGPMWSNPLEPVVRRLDFSGLGEDGGGDLFIGATNVRTGRIRIFSGDDITPQALLASACLPTVFQAVEIGDEAYWDGGYSGNPALFPLYDQRLPDDVVIIAINPLRRDAVPHTPLAIQDRINEIGFNTALMGELRAVAFVRRLIAEGRIEQGRMKDVRIHMIGDDDLMTELSASSKLYALPQMVDRLHQAGRVAASRFLTAHRDKIGHQPSFDIATLLG